MIKKFSDFFIKRERIFDIVCILAYTVLTLLLVLHHEPWRDEARPWLLVQKFGFFELFFRKLSQEGHPFLWYFLLFPFVKFGFPYSAMLLLNWIIAVGAAALFVIKAPFPRVFKCAFIFSYYMFYEYAVIARNYALSTFILFAVASFYKKRHESMVPYCICLFLLFNTHYFLYPLAAALWSLLVYETFKRKDFSRQSVIALGIASLGALLAFLNGLLIATDVHAEGMFKVAQSKNIFEPIARFLFPAQWDISYNLSVIIGFVVLVLLFAFFLRKPGIFYLFLVSNIFLFYFFMCLYPGNLRHFGLVLMICLFLLWIELYHPPSLLLRFGQEPFQKIRTIIMIIVFFGLALSWRASQLTGFLEWRRNFSASKEAAKKIEEVSKKSNLQNEVIVCDRSDAASAVVPYLPNRKFWFAEIQGFGTYQQSSKRYLFPEPLRPEEVLIRAGKNFQGLDNLIFLFTRPIEFDQRFGYQFVPIYASGNDVWGYGIEKYFIYKARPIP